MVKGPASCLPSIERACGRPVESWFAVLDALRDRMQVEQVAILDAEHGLGHGHANAAVASWRGTGGG